MNIKFLTYCDHEYEPIGSLTIPIMRDYCRKHNFEFILNNKITGPHRDVYWNKISTVRENLGDSDWVLWSDIDIMIFDLNFNWENYLEKMEDKDLILSSDYGGLCLGFFLIRNCEWSFRLLASMELMGNINSGKVGIYDKKNQREQDTLKVLADFFENISCKIDLIPESLISNPRSSLNGITPFAHHFWASRGIPKVIDEIKSPKFF